jgi:phosphoribosylglycinamide formyltransferase 1
VGINKNSQRVIKSKSPGVEEKEDFGLPDFIRVAVLVSGGGTNLQALIDSLRVGKSESRGLTDSKVYRLPGSRAEAAIVLVVSNNPNAYALVRAQKAGIETLVLSGKKYRTRSDYAKALVGELKKREVDLVCLAGFMMILDPYFIRHFKNKILNVHPALLPAFGGKGMYGHYVHEAVLKSGAKFSGCTVHFVDEKCDTGPIIMQRTVPVLDNDTPESLAKRILKFEHRVYPEAVKLIAGGGLKIEGKRVRIKKRCAAHNAA